MYSVIYKYLLSTLLMAGSILTLPHLALGQVVDDRSIYRSDVDTDLTIRNISVLPFSDNVQGIYARPLEQHMIEILRESHRWDYITANAVGPILSPLELEEDKAKARKISDSLEADAFIVSRITKGPKGISIVLDLFLTKDAQLLAQARVDNHSRFELERLKEKMNEMWQKVVSDIPYRARVLSRQGNRVTLNLGKRDGVRKDQVITVSQVIKANRHPKFRFIINTEKEILGRVKILKVDETLSFGMIISEKEKGAIQKDSKISGVKFVTYPSTDSLTRGTPAESQLMGRDDSAISFGQNAKAWLPKRPPSFGQFGARLGLGSYTGNFKLNSAGNLDSSNPYYPNIVIEGELWLTPKLTIHAGLKQGIIPISNPLSGSDPSDVSQSMSHYSFLLGYTMRLSPSVWGPSVELLAGYGLYKLFVDDSEPRGLTTMKYSGLKTGVRGQFPITADKMWFAGAQLFFFLNPSLSESPVTSGNSSDNTVNEFSVFGARKLGENLKVQVQLDFELYSSTFSGSGTRSGDSATSSSQRHTTLTGGVYYLF